MVATEDHATILVAEDLPLVVEDELGKTPTVQEQLYPEQYLRFVAAILASRNGFLHAHYDLRWNRFVRPISTYRRMRRLAIAKAKPRTLRFFRPLMMRPRVRELRSAQITIFALLMTVASSSI